MRKSEEYRSALRATPPERWDAWLAAHSGLPGPRANLELAQVLAEEAPRATRGPRETWPPWPPTVAGEFAKAWPWACNASATPTCPSVVVAALPAEGFARLQRWAAADDPDLRWLVRENFRKSRMRRADPERWACLRELARLEPGS